MTKNKIKKALECCTNTYSCVECPYHIAECNNRLCKDALNLITEQEKEIERLKAENCELTKKFEARLTCDFVKTAQKHAQIDVLNELKKYLHTEDFDTPDERWKPESEFCEIIDKLIKEVKNEKKD